jgi:predicted AAA+ superfamily ATPase
MTDIIIEDANYEEDGFYEGDECDGPTIMSSTIENKKDDFKSAKHYVKKGSTSFSFVDDIVDELPPAFYRPTWDSYNQLAILEKRDIALPKLYRLPDSVFEIIMKDVEHFWESEAKYKAFGNVYKRNILLYSVPGNGKTSLINLLSFELIERYRGIIMTINSIQDLIAYTKCVERVRNVEPNRKIITIIEDFDGLVGQDKNAETMLLQILDGNNQYANVVTIATTNYIETLKPSFTNRPSRFNCIIEYKKPNAEVRKFYFTSKLRDSGIDVEKQEVIDQINRLTQISEGYTFDFCKELAELIFVMEYSEEDAAARIADIIKHKGKYKITEDNNSIGFLK